MFLPEMRNRWNTLGIVDKSEFLEMNDSWYYYYGDQIIDWEITRRTPMSSSEVRANAYGANATEGIVIRVEAESESRYDYWTFDFDMIKVGGKWFVSDIW